MLIVCFSVSILSSSYALEESNTKETQQNKSTNKEHSHFFIALESALKNNKDILSAQKSLLAGHEEHVKQSAAFKPKISAEAGYSPSFSDSWISHDKANKETSQTGDHNSSSSYEVRVNQNIFNGLADIAALRETDFNIRAQWSEYEALKQRILREISELYFSLVAKKQEITHLRSLLESRKSIVVLASQMHATGSIKILDVAQSQADCASTEGKLATAEAEYEALCAQFEEKTGIPVPENLTIPQKLFDTTLTLEKAKNILTKSNPEVIAATDKLAAAKEAIKKPDTSTIPSVNISYSIKQSVSNRKQNSRSHGVGLGISIPIYDGGVGRASKRQAIETANKAAIDKEKALQQNLSALVATLASLSAAQENLICSIKALEACDIALHDTEEEFKAGVKITKDVLDAQQKLFEARFVKTQAEKNFFVSQCAANALLGRMNAKYLNIRDSDFNYKDHFAQTKKRF
jgi:outer membrane protein TolC